MMKEDFLLMVDDDPVFSESLSCALGQDFFVQKALSGIDALKLLDSSAPSLIILDLHMPGMDGCNLLRKIRSSGNKIPVIVLTGNSSHECAKECADLIVQGYMEKPVDVNRLILKIRKLLGKEESGFFKELFGDDYAEKMQSFSPLVRKAILYLQDNYKIPGINRVDIASHLNISPEYLSRLFHKECGLHLNEFINMLRVNKCKEYLLDFDKKMNDIGLLVGIPDINYLSRLFKKHTELTPLEFRKKSHLS